MGHHPLEQPKEVAEIRHQHSRTFWVVTNPFFLTSHHRTRQVYLFPHQSWTRSQPNRSFVFPFLAIIFDETWDIQAPINTALGIFKRFHSHTKKKAPFSEPACENLSSSVPNSQTSDRVKKSENTSCMFFLAAPGRQRAPLDGGQVGFVVERWHELFWRGCAGAGSEPA